MAVTFESYERRIEQIKPVMEKYGIKDFEDALKICTDKGFNPYEIVLDAEGKCIFNFTCPVEYPIYDGENFDIIFTVDVPETYRLTNFEFLDESSDSYVAQDYKENPRHTTVVRNGVTCNSYVRQVEDNNDYGSEYVAMAPLQYRITIEK